MNILLIIAAVIVYVLIGALYVGFVNEVGSFNMDFVTMCLMAVLWPECIIGTLLFLVIIPIFKIGSKLGKKINGGKHK